MHAAKKYKQFKCVNSIPEREKEVGQKDRFLKNPNPNETEKMKYRRLGV